jgi:hypothetical protein
MWWIVAYRPWLRYHSNPLKEEVASSDAAVKEEVASSDATVRHLRMPDSSLGVGFLNWRIG